MDDLAQRRWWMGVLAKADGAGVELLETAWSGLKDRPGFAYLRKPETGLVMVRARAGGAGKQFNLGEMTMTQCAVVIPDGSGRDRVGFGYVAGRAIRHSELAALFDALLQDGRRRGSLIRDVVTPLSEREKARKHAIRAKADTTKVEFFTMVRGED